MLELVKFNKYYLLPVARFIVQNNQARELQLGDLAGAGNLAGVG